MSARQPFVPSRPASRPVAAHDDATVNPSLDPLHRDPPKPPISFLTKKPLNLSCFVKNDTSSPSQTSTRTVENIIRPATVDQLQNRRIANMKIAAPTPSSAFSANLSSAMFAIDDSAFKLPSLPSAKPAHASDGGDPTQQQSFPITPEPGSRLSSYSDSALPSSLSASTLKTGSTGSSPLEQVSGRADKDEHADPPGFGINTPRAREGGPLRVLANSRLRTSIDSHRRNSLEDTQGDDLSREQEENLGLDDGQKEKRLSRHGKRGRSARFENDMGQDEEIEPVKRYKIDIQSEDHTDSPGPQAEYVSDSGQRHPSSHRSGYHQSETYNPNDDLLHFTSHPHLPRPHRHRTFPSSPVPNHLPPIPWSQQHDQQPHQVPRFNSHGQRQEQQDRQPSVSESAFNKILGEDVEAYVAEQAGVYETAQRRWEEASLEEWVAGADELAKSFAKVLNFVKDHMTTKMKLYANLDEKLEGHGVILEEREKTLTHAKEDLLKSGGSLLTGGLC